MTNIVLYYDTLAYPLFQSLDSRLRGLHFMCHKNYLSTSPSTISMLPIAAMTSARSLPSIIFGSA